MVQLVGGGRLLGGGNTEIYIFNGLISFWREKWRAVKLLELNSSSDSESPECCIASGDCQLSAIFTPFVILFVWEQTAYPLIRFTTNAEEEFTENTKTCTVRLVGFYWDLFQDRRHYFTSFLLWKLPSRLNLIFFSLVKEVCLISAAACDLLEWQKCQAWAHWLSFVGRQGWTGSRCSLSGLRWVGGAGLQPLAPSSPVPQHSWHFQEPRLLTLWQNIYLKILKNQLPNEYCFAVKGNKTYQQQT